MTFECPTVLVLTVLTTIFVRHHEQPVSTMSTSTSACSSLQVLFLAEACAHCMLLLGLFGLGCLPSAIFYRFQESSVAYGHSSRANQRSGPSQLVPGVAQICACCSTFTQVRQASVFSVQLPEGCGNRSRDTWYRSIDERSSINACSESQHCNS